MNLTSSTVSRRSNPDGKPVWLESVIAVPTDDPENFDEGFLRPEKVDMSNDFLKDCGNNHFYLPPTVEGDFMVGKVTNLRIDSIIVIVYR